MIPHPPIPLLEIRVLDVWLLLVAGATVELLSRSVSLAVKKKASKEMMAEEQLFRLQFEVAQKRRLGPSAFVETSKLERQVLAKEKEVSAFSEKRKQATDNVSRWVQNISFAVYVIVFLLYFSLPVMSIDGTRVGEANQVFSKQQDKERATAFLQGFLFPLSYIGLGMRVARFGLPQPGVGALVILWSSQVTLGKIIDGVEALMGVA